MTRLRRLGAVLATASMALALVPPAHAVSSTSQCASTVVISARGTNEPSGSGAQAKAIAQEIQRNFSQTVRTDYLASNVYPAKGTIRLSAVGAVISSLEYRLSVAAGERALRSRLEGLATKCPKTWTILVGYSQGANVVGDVIDVGGTQLSSKAKGRIKAVILLGDPRFRANQNYSTGDYERGRSGLIPRGVGEFGSLASRVRSFCNKNDLVCQRGKTSISAHSDYVKHKVKARDFARTRY